MVGGFSESPYLKAHIKSKFERDGLTILVPKRPQVSVIRGACMFGLNPRSITSRISKKTYGINTLTTFDPQRHTEEKKVVIFAAGTGNPFFTTDTAAALRGAEIGAEIVLKATKVDGVYNADPAKDPSAVRYQSLTFDEAIGKNLKVMDATAFALCRDQRLPIRVLSVFKKGALLAAVRGEPEGTLVHV